MDRKVARRRIETEPRIDRTHWRKQARIEAGLTPAEAAKKARICEDYLRRVERNGGASWVLATRLAHLYGCSANLFL